MEVVVDVRAVAWQRFTGKKNPVVRPHGQYRKSQKVLTSCEDLAHINEIWLICYGAITLKLLAYLTFSIVGRKKLSFQGSFYWSNDLT